MIGAGALEVGLDVAGEKRAPADKHGLHESAALARPKLHDLRQYTAPRCAAPQPKPATLKAGQEFHPAGACRAGQTDSLRCQVAGHVHGARVAIVSRHSQLGHEVETLAVGVHAQRGFCTRIARVVFFGLFAVDGQANPDRFVEHPIAQAKLLGLHVNRLLPATVGTVAHQSFANDIGGDIDRVLASGKWLEIGCQRGLCGIACLKIKAAKRHDRQRQQNESELGRAAIEERRPGHRNEKCNQPGERRTPEIICRDDARGESQGRKEDGLLAAAVKLCGRGRGGALRDVRE